LNRTNEITKRLAGTLLCFGLTVGLGGCRHKPQLAPLPPVMSPVALEDIPEPDNLPMVEAAPENQKVYVAGLVKKLESKQDIN